MSKAYRIKAVAFKMITGQDTPVNSGLEIGSKEFNKRSKSYIRFLKAYEEEIKDLISEVGSGH